jgi:carbon-monoxide dehydrogenase catalytic subunit
MAYTEKILGKSIDPSVHKMLERAEQLNLETVWDRYEAMLPEC